MSEKTLNPLAVRLTRWMRDTVGHTLMALEFQGGPEKFSQAVDRCCNEIIDRLENADGSLVMPEEVVEATLVFCLEKFGRTVA